MPRDGLEELLDGVGRRLRAARGTVGWTQERLADACGIDVKRLQRIEAGGVNITLKTLWRLADALELPIAQLLEPAIQLRIAANPDAD